MTVNGAYTPLDGEKSLFDFLKEAGFDESRIAVERNGQIVSRTEYQTVLLEEGDKIEIVRFVGGG